MCLGVKNPGREPTEEEFVMPIRIEKKLIDPVTPPGYEEVNHPDPSHPRAKVLPWWLVFSREVPAGSDCNIMASSQLPFRGYRLSIDPQIAPSFLVLNLTVGKNSYSINGHEGVAATLFPPIPNKLSPEERADYEELLKMNLDAAQIGQTVGLRVKNVSSRPLFFSGILWGYAVGDELTAQEMKEVLEGVSRKS